MDWKECRGHRSWHNLRNSPAACVEELTSMADLRTWFWTCDHKNRTLYNPCYFIYLSIYLSIYLWLYSPFLDLGRFFSFLTFYTVGRTPWTGDQAVERPLPAHRTAQTQNKRTQTSMPWVGFEATIPVFDRAKTVHALYRAALYSVALVRKKTIPTGRPPLVGEISANFFE
jgi:hypothetical protein